MIPFRSNSSVKATPPFHFHGCKGVLPPACLRWPSPSCSGCHLGKLPEHSCSAPCQIGCSPGSQSAQNHHTAKLSQTAINNDIIICYFYWLLYPSSECCKKFHWFEWAMNRTPTRNGVCNSLLINTWDFKVLFAKITIFSKRKSQNGNKWLRRGILEESLFLIVFTSNWIISGKMCCRSISEYKSLQDETRPLACQGHLCPVGL